MLKKNLYLTHSSEHSSDHPSEHSRSHRASTRLITRAVTLRQTLEPALQPTRETHSSNTLEPTLEGKKHTRNTLINTLRLLFSSRPQRNEEIGLTEQRLRPFLTESNLKYRKREKNPALETTSRTFIREYNERSA